MKTTRTILTVALLGISRLIEQIVPIDPHLTVVEAAGGLETAAVCAFAARGLPVAVVNPRHVRDFAKSKGILAKTDKIDAKGLCKNKFPFSGVEARAWQGARRANGWPFN